MKQSQNHFEIIDKEWIQQLIDEKVVNHIPINFGYKNLLRDRHPATLEKLDWE